MDRIKLLVGARLLSSWRRVIVVVQPETVLRWLRAGFRLFWRRRSRPRKPSPLPSETIDLIRDMAMRGRLWGAERIGGELLKLGIKVSKRTIQKYMRGIRNRGGDGQSWATFLKNHAERMWVCDFVQTHDLLFRQVYAFFLLHLASRHVVYVAATRHPTQAWTARQLRNATLGRGRSGRVAAGPRRQVRPSVRPSSPRRRRQGYPDGGSRAEYERSRGAARGQPPTSAARPRFCWSMISISHLFCASTGYTLTGADRTRHSGSACRRSPP
jgi:hypothetical protein